jgi:hypothetical protein
VRATPDRGVVEIHVDAAANGARIRVGGPLGDSNVVAGVARRLVEGTLARALGVVAIDHGAAPCMPRATERALRRA